MSVRSTTPSIRVAADGTRSPTEEARVEGEIAKLVDVAAAASVDEANLVCPVFDWLDFFPVYPAGLANFGIVILHLGVRFLNFIVHVYVMKKKLY